jgi:hypothetical protein
MPLALPLLQQLQCRPSGFVQSLESQPLSGLVLEHDSLASTLPGSIGGEAVVANMDGPDSRQRHVLGMRFGMGRKPPPAITFADLLAWLRFLLLRILIAFSLPAPAQIRLKSGSSRPTNTSLRRR